MARPAQYGSDAIAGVINVPERDADGGDVMVAYGALDYEL